MKTKLIITVFSLLLIANFGFSQNYGENESLGLPGDNLNLYATLKLFQESETLELFEQKLNDPESKINNLDLNGDNQIDYIRVIDNLDNNVHLITLQVAINNKEKQDVAVFVVQKVKDQIQIQLIGDEALYGKDYIIEPNMVGDNNSGGTPNPGYTGGNNNYSSSGTTVVTYYDNSEISNWPMVRYIYAPVYRPWNSPWNWGYYPTYWHSWSPFYWHYYWGYNYHYNDYYYAHYRHGNHYRYSRWNEYYGPRRSVSITYNKRRDRGDYKATYSRPDMASQGSESYRQKYPNSPSDRVALPDLKKPENKRILNPYENRKATIDSHNNNKQDVNRIPADKNQNNNKSDINRNPSGNLQNNSKSGINKNPATNNQIYSKPDVNRSPANNQNYSKPNTKNVPSNTSSDVKRQNNNVNPPSNRSDNNFKQSTPSMRQNTAPAAPRQNASPRQNVAPAAPRQNQAPAASQKDNQKSKDTEKKSDKRN